VQAGANIVTQACGAQASLMGISFEALVVDNDMLGCILRATNPVHISPQTLSASNIGKVASGAGHFLGEADTYARMHSDFLYPGIADRSVIDVWEAAGSHDIRHVAVAHVKEVLETHRPRYVDTKSDAILRASLPVELAV
jgi:trimethylamine--corrinoid protein Co-methyltransferase